MRKQYCCENSRLLYENYYTTQAGNGLPIFAGGRNQKGHGLGSMLSSLWRRAQPFLMRAGKVLLRQGASVARDMLDGQSFKEAARKRTSEGITTLLDENQGSEQTGSGRRRAKKRKRMSGYNKKKKKTSHKKKKKLGSKKRGSKKKTKRRKTKIRFSNRDIFSGRQ